MYKSARRWLTNLVTFYTLRGCYPLCSVGFWLIRLFCCCRLKGCDGGLTAQGRRQGWQTPTCSAERCLPLTDQTQQQGRTAFYMRSGQAQLRRCTTHTERQTACRRAQQHSAALLMHSRRLFEHRLLCKASVPPEAGLTLSAAHAPGHSLHHWTRAHVALTAQRGRGRPLRAVVCRP